MPRSSDTIASLATPVGTAALAVIRISGPDTERLAQEIVGRPLPPRVARHIDYVGCSGNLLDDVVVVFFRGPRSYTGEDSLEISCHGNPFVAQKILEDLFARGCRAAQPGEFTQRAFLNGRMDLSQSEAVMDLIHARSERALAAANSQLRGALGKRMAELIQMLLSILARIEAYIDFPEEDLPSEDHRALDESLRRLAAETQQLLATNQYGSLLRDGIRTVIVGEPNVGKSSLLNRLVGRERALVSTEPGTTRDFIEERVLIGPHYFRLVDTAGLNPSPAPLEALGMEKTKEQVAEADIVLSVFDALPFPETAPRLAQSNASKLSLIILNKSDLWSNKGPSLAGSPGVFEVSALTGTGIEALRSALISAADSFRSDIGDETIAINARHHRALSDAKLNLAQARSKLADASPIELVASDLRTVLNAFGEITGRVDNERVLDELFATFCIGK